MEYVIFIVGILIILIVLDKYINRNAKKELQEKLENEWGKRGEDKYTDEELERIKFYYKNTQEETDIDDITWNDLELDKIYSSINKTNCYIGREYLYAMLRRICFCNYELKKRNKLIEMFRSKKETRIKMQMELSNIGNKSDISIYEYLTRINKVESNRCIASKLQVLMLLISIVLIFFNSKIALAIAIAMIAVNISTYYYHKAKIAPYLSFFSYIVRMNKSLVNICRIDEDDLVEYQKELKGISNKLAPLRKNSYFLAQGNITGSFADIIMDYVKMIFHVDIIKFYSMLDIIKQNEKNIKRLYEIVGLIDSLCSVASFRETLPYWCYPDLDENNKGYKSEDIYHPLIEDAVSNSIGEEKSILLTGSNASGKSTFIKTLALNAVLSQTIYTSTSKKYLAPFYQIYTSMALRDNLLKGESYYIVEIKSLKRILNANSAIAPILCFVDEVLRGTNTLERISASAYILRCMAKDNYMCIAATHDIELTKILKNYYKCYHFKEEVLENDIMFDYKLYQGSAKSRNAIKLLSIIGYSEEIVDNASKMAIDFLESGVWNEI